MATDLLERADDLARLIDERLPRLFPAGVRLADAHTHLGLDEDGMTLDIETLTGDMRAAGIERALVFALNESDRVPQYTAPNDRVLDWAESSGGMLVPLARLDLGDEPIAEARRCFASGARGIKLHPRAQRFQIDDAKLEPVFALAEEHHVPVLIHAGRGMPPIGEHLARVAERHPGAILILAHAAIVDQARIARLVAGLPNVLFDTSTWGVFDLLTLFQRVPPEQIVYASDVPYGSFTTALALAAALLVECDAPDDLRHQVLGGTLLDLIDHGRLPQTMSAPLAPEHWPIQPAHGRLYAYVTQAIPQIWLGRPDVIGIGGLARTVATETDSLAPVAEMVDVGMRLWEAADDDFSFEEVGLRAYRLLAIAQLGALLPRAVSKLLS